MANKRKNKRPVYQISELSHRIARKMGYSLKPSLKQNFKIDIFNKSGEKYIDSAGHIDYKDYHIYKRLEKAGKVPAKTAQKEKKKYEARHIHRDKIGTRAWFADIFLWKEYDEVKKSNYI
jgi:hypothetical protein